MGSRLAYLAAGVAALLTAVAVTAVVALYRDIDAGRIDPDWWS